MFFEAKFGLDSFFLVCYFTMNCFSFSPIYIILYVCVCVCIYIIYMTSQLTLLVKNLPANAGDVRDAGLIPVSRRWARQRSSILDQKNPMDTVAWPATVHRFTKSWTQLK